MDPEANTHSFVIRIWLEEQASRQGRARWRGHVTHVSSGARRHVERLSEISRFIGTYLEAMGVPLEQENEGPEDVPQ